MRPGGRSRSAHGRAANPPTVPGVIETIAIGLSLALVYPLLALVPLLIDAVYWSGIELAPVSLAEGSSGRDFLASLGLERDLLPIFGFFAPSLLAWIDRDRLYTLEDGPVLGPESDWTLALVGLGLLLTGPLIQALFRVPIACVMRSQPIRPAFLGRAVARAWLRLLGFGALVCGAFVLLTLPVGVTGGLLYLVGVNALPLLMLTIGPLVLLALIYLSFVLDAIALSEVGPFRACYLSFNVVRHNFWAAVGLLAGVALISTGLPALWLSQASHPIGLLIGVFCNGLVATGLTAASMQFYSDRLGRWLGAEATGARPGGMPRVAPP
jgi:hypothetical protein